MVRKKGTWETSFALWCQKRFKQTELGTGRLHSQEMRKQADQGNAVKRKRTENKGAECMLDGFLDTVSLCSHLSMEHPPKATVPNLAPRAVHAQMPPGGSLVLLQ